MAGVILTIATIVATKASAWLHAELNDKVSSVEFGRFMDIHISNQQEIMNRLRSIEEAIRNIRK